MYSLNCASSNNNSESYSEIYMSASPDNHRGVLIQLHSTPRADVYYTGNPQVSFFAGGTTKKLLHPELYNADITKPFNPRTDDKIDFPKERYCGEIIFKEEGPILKKYGDSRYSNEDSHLVPFKVREDSKKIYNAYCTEDSVNTIVPYDTS